MRRGEGPILSGQLRHSAARAGYDGLVEDPITIQQRELALAAQLQAALLPRTCPADCPHQQAAARNRMCSTIGGDFYDFIRLNEDQIAIAIGDVVGHGVQASLMMAQIMGFLRSQARAISRPAGLISALNRMLIDLGDKIRSVMLCSVFYAIIDGPTGTGFFVNAGHPPGLLWDRDSGGIRRLASAGMLLGIEPFQPEEMCHTFTPGQRLVLYTDGIVDVRNPGGEQFGQKRLERIIAESAELGPRELVDRIFQAVDDFRGPAPQRDDETLVVVDRT